MSILDDIPIHIINLPHRVDRKATITKGLARCKLSNYRFVEAIRGSDLDIDAMAAQGLVTFRHRRLFPGEYGCYLSHLGVYREILDSDQELHLILEDDVYFINEFYKKLTKVLKRVENIPWDIFYIGVNLEEKNALEGEYVASDLFYPKNYWLWGTHAYLIKKSILQRLIDSMLPIEGPIDVFLMSRPNVKRLVMTNPIAKVHNLDSDTRK